MYSINRKNVLNMCLAMMVALLAVNITILNQIWYIDMSSLCVDSYKLRGLNIFVSYYYVDGKQIRTAHIIVGQYQIKSGSSIILSAPTAGNAQGYVWSSTNYLFVNII